MARGLIDPPNLDDRSWQDIVDECRALIPRYAPEWTDHNPSDLGITLMELFAWLVEGMIYRLNRVPEKNFIEFLNLLGISRDPATPASVFLTYSSASAATLPAGSQASTVQSTVDPPIVFETDAAVQLLPTNLTTAVYIYKLAVDKRANVTRHLVASPVEGLETLIFPTNDVTLVFGFDRATTATMTLSFRFVKAMVPGPVSLQWRYSRGTGDPSAWPSVAGVVDSTAAFTRNGSVSFSVPLDWATQVPKTDWPNVPADSLADELSQPLYWISVRLQNAAATAISVAFERVLFNSVHATNALTVPSPGEVLGTSTGKPFQTFQTRHVPLYKRPAAKNPYDHLVLQVREPLVGGGFGAWATWQRMDYLPAGAAQAFRLDPVTGTISFGNHDSSTPLGQGSIPAAGSEIRAAEYRYVAGGARGNVGAGTVITLRTPPPAGVTSVTNAGNASGGSDEEAIEDTKRRGPELLRNRSRAVTAQDYEYLVGEATTDVRKVRCLTPRLWRNGEKLANNVAALAGDPWIFADLNRDSGNVNVLVIGDAPLTIPAPTPSDDLIREVADYLEDRRTVTANLHVTGPRYVPIRATVNVNVWAKAVTSGLIPDLSRYRNDITARVVQFFHPLYGRGDGLGWNFGQDATIAELLDFIRPTPEIGFISALTIEPTMPPYVDATQAFWTQRPFQLGTAGVWVQLADYEIVCSYTSHAVTVTQI